MSIVLDPAQQDDMKRLRESGYCGLISAEPGYGKEQPNYEKVLTPTGWVQMGDIRVGDFVIGSAGKPVEVTGVFPQGEKQVVRVHFTDGSHVDCGWDHLWTYQTSNHKARGTFLTETLREIVDRGFVRGGKRAVGIPIVEPVEHPEATLPIDPYLLGVILGDGGIKYTPGLTTDTEILDKLETPLSRKPYREGVERATLLGLKPKLVELGLYGKGSLEKFIPEQYLIASIAQRQALLAGLMDTDGTVAKTPATGLPRYNTSSPQLMDDVRDLVGSLGGTVTVSQKEPKYTYRGETRVGATSYTLNIRMPNGYNPFTLPRKREAVTPLVKYGPVKYMDRVEELGVHESTCIMVDSPDHLYVTRGYTLTHNTVLAVFAMLEAGAEQVLVIAPDSTHLSAWDKTYHDLFEQPGHVRILGNKNKAQKEALADFEWGVAGWYVATPQFFTRAFNADWNPDAVIADEVHQYTNPGTRGQKHLSGRSRADRNPLAVRATYKLALSGTPARNKFERLWGVTRFLWPEEEGDFEVAEVPFSAWQKNRMRSEFNPFATSGRTYTTEILPGRLLREMPCVIQHKRRETCCEHHPGGFMPVAEPVVIEEIVDMTAKQKKTFTELESKGLAWLNDNPMVASLPITAQLRIRQAILGELSVEDYFDERTEQIKQRVWFEPNAKSPHADRIEELLDSMGDEPVLVLTASKIFAKYLTARLNKRGDTARELTGDTIKTRAQDVREFGDEFRVAVAVIDAIGTGTDGLGDRCATEIWADRSLDRANNTQAEARLDRRGQSRRVVRHILRDSTGYSERQYTRQAIASAELDKSLRTK